MLGTYILPRGKFIERCSIEIIEYINQYEYISCPCFFIPVAIDIGTLFSCDQAALWMVFSVRLSVCHTFLTMFPSSYHHEISGVMKDQGKVHAKGQGQRSKVKVREDTTQLNRFRTVTPVWIHIWWWNDAYSLMLLRRGALLFLKVIRQISRSHGAKNRRIWPRLGVSGL